MIEQIIFSIVSGLIAGSVAWGAMSQQVKTLSSEVGAMHTRVDALMMALAQHGLIEMGAAGHLSRVRDRP